MDKQRTLADYERLPKWVQKELSDLRHFASQQTIEIAMLQAAHAVLAKDRRWFTISRPPFASHRPATFAKLWYLAENEPVCICDLGPNDTLLVGRAKPEEE